MLHKAFKFIGDLAEKLRLSGRGAQHFTWSDRMAFSAAVWVLEKAYLTLKWCQPFSFQLAWLLLVLQCACVPTFHIHLLLPGSQAKDRASALYKLAHDSGKFKGRTTMVSKLPLTCPQVTFVP